MSNFYCFSIDFHKDISTKKLKMDYALIPVSFIEQNGNKCSFKSKVAEEEPFILKKENKEFYGSESFSFFKKKKDVVKFVIVIETKQDSLELVEEFFLPKVKNRIKKKLLFRPSYKNFLEKRIATILNSK